jgi:hypothetical protein
VIRACLRRAPCPVVVISAAQEPLPRWEAAGRGDELHVPVPAGAADAAAEPVPADAVKAAPVPSGGPSAVPVPAGACG